MSDRKPPHHSRASVTLVALCCVAVLGIGLASFLAVSNQSMRLSNRSMRTDLSRQLAEVGIEEALRAYNKNVLSGTDTTAAVADWTNAGVSTNWTLDTNNKLATCAISFPASKFGQGITGSVKVRIDNYDAAQLASVWNSAVTYRINDLVGYNSAWYRSVRNSNTNHAPGNLTWWVQTPTPWMWSPEQTYNQYDVVNYKGIWYRYVNSTAAPATTPTLPVPTGAAVVNWVPIPSMRAWATSTSYAQYDVVAYTDVTGDVSVQRCLAAHTSSAAFSTDAANWTTDVRSIGLSWTGSGTIYTRGAIVFYNSYWYYCRKSGPSSTAPDSDTTLWAPFNSDAAGPVLPSAATEVNPTTYVAGDYVYHGGSWLRCTAATDSYAGTWHGGSWTSTNARPSLSWAYNGNPASYEYNDVVYTGLSGSNLWYRSTGGGGYELALTGPMYAWSSGIKYNVGDAVFYTSNSQWYRCLVAHTSAGGLTPTNAAYWSTAPAHSIDWEPNRQYNQYDTVRYNGDWYLSLQNSNFAQNPGAASSLYWAISPNYLQAWDSTKGYNLNDLVSYSGTWYRCIQSPTSNQAPTDTNYWVIAIGASYQWNASTPYGGGAYASYGGIWYQCVTGNTGQSPNNSTYWTASWQNSWDPSGTKSGPPVVYAEGTVTLADGTTTATQLRATIAPAGLFGNAAAATGTFNVTGGTGVVDSYDGSPRSIVSGDTYHAYPYFFSYDDQSHGPFSPSNHNKGYAAVLASNATSTPAITLGNGTAVSGYVSALSSSTTPFAPLVSFGSSASVKGATSAAAPNVDLARISRSPNIQLFDPLPSGGLAAAFTAGNFPKGSALAFAPVTNIGTPGAATPSRYYYNGNLTIGTATIATLNIYGPVILYVNGDLIVTASGATGTINIDGAGSAEIHVAGSLKIDQSGAGINNQTKDPKRLIVIADTAGSGLQYYGDGGVEFYGVLYVPNTTTTLGLNFNNTSSPTATTYAVYGAILAKKITYDNSIYLHYDTSLRYTSFGGIEQPYAISQWRELPQTEQATMP